MANAKQIKAAKQTLSAERMEKGLSLRKLYKNTPPYYRNTGNDDVIVKKYKPDAKTKGGHHAITAVCKSTSHNSKTHKCSIIGREKGGTSQVTKQKRVSVSCDCEDFCFTWEYALMTWGAATIKYSNGEPAVMRNPGNVPGMCKHLCAVAALAIERQD